MFFESDIDSFFSSSVATFACLNLTSDSTHDEVSSPDANPLNDIVIFCYSCSLIRERLGYMYRIRFLFLLSTYHLLLFSCKNYVYYGILFLHKNPACFILFELSYTVMAVDTIIS